MTQSPHIRLGPFVRETLRATGELVALALFAWFIFVAGVVWLTQGSF